MDKTMIIISKDLREFLRTNRISKRESYEEVIRRMIAEIEVCHKNLGDAA